MRGEESERMFKLMDQWRSLEVKERERKKIHVFKNKVTREGELDIMEEKNYWEEGIERKEKMMCE